MSMKLIKERNARIIGTVSALVAISIGFLVLDLNLIYMPCLIVASTALFILLKNLDKCQFWRSGYFVNLIFCIVAAFFALIVSVLAGSVTNFILATMEFYYPSAFHFKMIVFDHTDGKSFSWFFQKEAPSFIIAPLFWILIFGSIPCFIAGSVYGHFRWRSAKNA